MGDVSAEHRVLEGIARRHIGTANDEDLSVALTQPIDWPLLLRRASKEGMAGVAAHQLQQLSQVRDLDLPLGLFTEALNGIFFKNGNHFAELARLHQERQSLCGASQTSPTTCQGRRQSHPPQRLCVDRDGLSRANGPSPSQ
jgi:hypothetical protein